MIAEKRKLFFFLFSGCAGHLQETMVCPSPTSGPASIPGLEFRSTQSGSWSRLHSCWACLCSNPMWHSQPWFPFPPLASTSPMLYLSS